MPDTVRIAQEAADIINPTEQLLLAIMMAIIMLGMGASLTFKDFRLALRNPKGIAIGFASQYLFMPFIAFSLAYALGLPALVAAGLILMGCMPGGTTSNIFAYFSKSMLSLSILMTVCSTLAAVVMVPLIFGGYTTLLGAATGEVGATIPASNIVAVLVLLLVPTLIGMWTRKRNANVGAMFELVGSLVGVLVIIFLIATWVPRNWQLLVTTGPEVYGAAIGLGLVGFLIGYWFARGFRMDRVKARTVSLETGIQNGPLAALVIVLAVSDQDQAQVLLIPALYMLFIVITSTIITIFYRRRSTSEALARDEAKVELQDPPATAR